MPQNKDGSISTTNEEHALKLAAGGWDCHKITRCRTTTNQDATFKPENCHFIIKYYQCYPPQDEKIKFLKNESFKILRKCR